MKPSQLTRRHAMIFGLSAGLIGGLGCATAIVSSGPSTTTALVEGAVAVTDDIVAFGRPNEAMAKAIGKADAVAFLGTSHTYLLVEGGEALLGMTALDPARLTLTPDSHRLHIKDNTIWGTLEFTYSGEINAETDEVKAALKALKFVRRNPSLMTLNVNVKGAVYPAMPTQGQQFTVMQKPRKLVFRAPNSTETKPDLSKIVKLPAAIVFDVVTAPLQLLGAAVVMISIASSH